MNYLKQYPTELPLALLDILPDPVMVKSSELKYVWANKAFLDLFSITLTQLVGKEDIEVFPTRQASQCNGGDKRVLASGIVDDAIETIVVNDNESRETITRKSRLTLADGTNLLVGVMHDVTHVVHTNRQLESLSEQLAIKNKELDSLANTDMLTSCLNRRAFILRAREMVKTTSVGLLIVDVDHFKNINDQYGHAAGDACLKHLVEISLAQIRPDDELARLGGEEFAFLLPNSNSKDVRSIGERVRSAIATASFQFDGDEINMTVSIGGVFSDISDASLDELLKFADKNLYQAKHEGRNRVIFDSFA